MVMEKRRKSASSSQQIWPLPYQGAGLGEHGLDFNPHYPLQLGALVHGGPDLSD